MSLSVSLALSTLDVSAIAEGLAAGSVPWDLGVAESPVDRRYEQIVSTAAYDAWLIYWPPGSSIEMHDHGDSIGALRSWRASSRKTCAWETAS